MTEHEYQVNFILENSFISTCVYLAEEDTDLAIAVAYDRLGQDGVNAYTLDIIEITATKTGELR
jgi:hypothetical protein